MRVDRYRKILTSQRLPDLVRLSRRVLGLNYLKPEDFLPDISPTDAARLADLARNARGEGPAPILVMGVMPRSGTNFIRDLLAQHPDVHADPGRYYEFPLLHAARGMGGFADEFLSYFPRNAEIMGRWDPLALLAGAWMRELQREAGSRHILLKCPHVQNLTLAPLIFPDAKIVLCVRDGRDVIDSTQRTFGRWSPARKTFAQLSEEWRLGVEAIYAVAEAPRQTDADVVVLRYEDVVTDTRSAMRNLLERMGLQSNGYPFTKLDAMPVRGSSRSKASDDTRWQPEAKTADFNPVRRWADWPAPRKARFDRIAGPSLRLAGYDA